MTPPRILRALRGAITVLHDEAMLICDATRQLLEELLRRNQLDPTDVVSAIFTVTADLRSEFPARAARDLGWHEVAMVCVTEMPVPGSIARCIRVLLHVELPVGEAPKHAYLLGAEELRPDL